MKNLNTEGEGKMSQVQTGSCPICGAPIYAESPWWSILPPPPIYTCSCTAHKRRTITTTTAIIKDVMEGKMTPDIESGE